LSRDLHSTNINYILEGKEWGRVGEIINYLIVMVGNFNYLNSIWGVEYKQCPVFFIYSETPNLHFTRL
jgi:hypothetical protein